ncbi:hypothetical protein V2J52_10785 [Georgenia sp. MJ173]
MSPAPRRPFPADSGIVADSRLVTHSRLVTDSGIVDTVVGK